MTALLTHLKPRSYAGETDLPAIAALMNQCRDFDHLDDRVSVDELRHAYTDPDFNGDRDLRLWVDQQGHLCAVASCWFFNPTQEQECYLGFNIHPEMRDRGVEVEILAWAENLAQQVACDRGVPAKLRSAAQSHQLARLDLLKQHGFVPVRTFYRMARSLTDSIPTPTFPAGFQVRSLQGEAEVADWVDLFNQSFVDHWNFHPLTVADRLHWMAAPAYQPDLDLVAVASDGTLAAFCHSVIRVHNNELTGRSDGWIADLGTRRGFRRRGLGRAMLLTGLHALQAKGLDTALLGVDAENPSGALTLYESVGFQQRHQSITHVKDLDPLPNTSDRSG